MLSISLFYLVSSGYDYHRVVWQKFIRKETDHVGRHARQAFAP